MKTVVFLIKSHRIVSLILCLCFLTYCSSKSDKLKNKLILNDTVINNVLNNVFANQSLARKVLDSIEPLCKKNEDKFLFNLIYSKFYRVKDDYNNFSKHLYLCDSIIQIDSFAVKQFPKVYMRFLFLKIEDALSKTNFLKAKKTLLEVEQYSISHDSLLLNVVYDFHSNFYFQSDEPEKMISYLNKQIHVFKKPRKYDSIGYFYSLGICYSKCFDKKRLTHLTCLDSSKLYLSKAQNLLKKKDDWYYYAIKSATASNMGREKNYKNSLRENLSIYREKERDSVLNEIEAYNVSKAYNDLRMFDSSIYYINIGLKSSVSSKDKKSQLDYYNLLAKNHFGKHDYRNAYINLENSNNIRDEVDNQVDKQKIAQLEADFKEQLKNQEIKTLAAEKRVAQKDANMKNWLLLSLGLATAVGGFIYYQLTNKQKLKQQINAAELEQQLLRTQMNPHFVFNSLTSMKSLIASGENKLAEMYVAKFARLLRLVLENSSETFVNLNDEIEALENYMQLQQMRYDHSFEFKIDISDDVREREIQVSPMLIQPFVENAIEHGLKMRKQDGKLSLNLSVFKEASNSLICTISDNGSGIMEQQIVEEGLKKKSLSTKITAQRLQLLAKQLKSKGEIVIERLPTTKVTLIIPYR
jgi:two-component sensor histidine kinase